MKIKYYILLFFVGINISGWTQNFDFLNSNKQWIIGLDYSETYSHGTKYTLYGFNDSIVNIDSFEYKTLQSYKTKLEGSKYNFSPGMVDDYVEKLDTTVIKLAYMRMDSNNVIYCKMITSQTTGLNWQTDEFIFMKPDLQIGDTLKYPIDSHEKLVVINRYFDTFTNRLTQTLDSALTYKFDVIDGNIDAEFSYIYGFLQSGPLYTRHDQFENHVPEFVCYWDGMYSNISMPIAFDTTCANSGIFMLKDVSIHSITNKNNISVYPNPVISSFKVITTNQAINTNWKLVIYNSLGQLVKNELYNIGNEVNVENLSTGLYMLQLIDDGQLFYISKFEKR